MTCFLSQLGDLFALSSSRNTTFSSLIAYNIRKGKAVTVTI